MRRLRSGRDVRVLVVDGDTLRGLIEAAAHTKVVSTASNLYDALFALKRTGHDVVAVDVERVGASPVDATHALRGRSPGSHVILFEADRDEDTLIDLIVAGAAAYLPPDLPPAELHGLLKCVAHDGVALDPWAASVLLRRFGQGTVESATGVLTAVEVSLLRRLAAAPSQGTTDETAAALAASACARVRDAAFICA